MLHLLYHIFGIDNNFKPLIRQRFLICRIRIFNIEKTDVFLEMIDIKLYIS